MTPGREAHPGPRSEVPLAASPAAAPRENVRTDARNEAAQLGMHFGETSPSAPERDGPQTMLVEPAPEPAAAPDDDLADLILRAILDAGQKGLIPTQIFGRFGPKYGFAAVRAALDELSEDERLGLAWRRPEA